MKKTFKKSLALLLAALMVVSILPTFAITALAKDKRFPAQSKWISVATNDLSSSNWIRDGRTFSGNDPEWWGWAMAYSTTAADANDNAWITEQYYSETDSSGNTNPDVDRRNIGVSDNGYYYLNASQTPITGLDDFLIDVGFKFIDNTTTDPVDFVIDKVAAEKKPNDPKDESEGGADFLILTTNDNCSWFNGDAKSNYVFKQNGYGNITINNGTALGEQNPSEDYRIATNNNNINKNTKYHYVLSYKDGTITAQVTDDNGAAVIDYGSYENVDIDTNAIKNIVIGITNGPDASCNYQNIQYSNIDFYRAAETYTVTFTKNGESSPVDTREIAEGDALGTLPANTEITSTDATHHNVYSWGSISASTVVSADADYTESETTANCVFTASSQHYDADETTNGYTEKFCECGNSQITYDDLDYDEYNAALQVYNETISDADYATKYTEDSRKDYEDAVDDAKLTDAQLNNPALPQSIIDAAKDAILEAGALLVVPTPKNTYNLTLDGKIKVNFAIDTEFYNAQGGTVEVEYVTTNYVDGEIVLGTDTAYYNAPAEGKTTITMDVAPAQIAEPYVITIKDNHDDEITSFSTSIVDYCSAITGGEYSDADKEVAKGLLDYGSASETYFNYRASASTPGYSVDHSDDYADFVAAFDAESFRSKAKCSQVEGTDASGKSVYVTGVSYIAQLDPEFRFYINQDNEVYAAMTDVSIDTEGLTAKMVKTANGFCVSVKGLKASDFAKTFTITIGTYKLTYNGYAFLYTTLREDGGTTDTNLRDLALGVYRYAAACEAKFA